MKLDQKNLFMIMYNVENIDPYVSSINMSIHSIYFSFSCIVHVLP